MKAKYFILDFINFLFLIALSTFLFFYFLQGDRIQNAGNFFEAMSKFSFFGIFFFAFAKKNSKKISHLKKEEKKRSYFELIKYLSYKDEIKDWIYLISLPIIIIFSAHLFNSVDKIDLIQAFLVFYVMAILHKYIFNKKKYNSRNFLTNADKMIDEIAVYSLPMIIMGISIIFKSYNNFDFIQSLIILIESLIWHYFLFMPKK